MPAGRNRQETFVFIAGDMIVEAGATLKSAKPALHIESFR